MIIITVKSGFRFCYRGSISLIFYDVSVHIDACDYDSNPDNLYTWDKKVFDIFWLEDIESIRGEYDISI